MKEYAIKEEFEKAAEVRDQLQALSNLYQHQTRHLDMDVPVIAEDESQHQLIKLQSLFTTNGSYSK